MALVGWAAPLFMGILLLTGWAVLPLLMGLWWLRTGCPWPPTIGVGIVGAATALAEWGIHRWRADREGSPHPLLLAVGAVIAGGVLAGPLLGGGMALLAVGPEAAASLASWRQRVWEAVRPRVGRTAVALVLWYGVSLWLR